MATYAHWRQHYADKGLVKRITWICGDERVLVEEVVTFIREHLGASDLDYASLVAGDAPDRDIWAEINQYPVDHTADRLVVVRDVEKVKSWAPFQGWVETTSRTMPRNHIVLVSGARDFPYVYAEGKKTPEMYDPVGWIKGKGHLVRCATPNEADLLAWVHRRVQTTDDTAKHLLTRVSGDLRKAQAVCWKSSLFAGEMTKTVVDALCRESVGDEFVDALLAMDRHRALVALEGMDEAAYSGAIGLLEHNLGLMSGLYKALRERKSFKDLAVAGEWNQFVLMRLDPLAKHYDPERRQKCRRALSVADEALRSGAHAGAMEALCALW